MTGDSAIHQRALAQQARAADPSASIWVAASAGTGKTKVLTDRVLGLMLAGTAPERILCLTFTKAAAAEMATRIAKRLARWVSLDDGEARDDLEELLGRPASADELSAARQLFARVLDAQGGLKIQTIHAFCQSLLGRFPLEAGIAPHAQVLDDRSAAEMLAAARETVLAAVAEPAAAPQRAALDVLASHLDEAGFSALLTEVTRERGRFGRLVETQGIAGLNAAVHRRLGIAPEDTVEAIRRRAVEDSALDLLGLRLAVRALAAGTATEQAKAVWLQAWLESAPSDRLANFDAYRALYLTGDNEPRQKLLHKAAKAAEPGAQQVMEAEAARLRAVLNRCNSVVIAQATGALVTLGAAVLEDYGRHKQRQALLDYDDLILLSERMLATQGMAGWVLYKLDGGLDHVLIDEAQDTNPEQWQVVEAITREFFAGEGAREAVRTVFAVGDVKQSIFSFQRADPEAFLAMRKTVAERAAMARQRWDSVELDVSFRSTAAVLAAVDAVFARPEAHDGVAADGSGIGHRVRRAGQGGVVELWPPAPLDVPDAEAPWTAPVVRRGAAPPRQRLARLIARRIHYWTRDPGGAQDPESRLASSNRRLRPQDFLILVRRRNEFVEEVVRALKLLDVPVAGIDRMVLTDQLAVMDLVALGRFALMPEDDLTLATVLKGPFVGLSEVQLFDLAHGRDGPLWHALRARAGADRSCAWAADVLSQMLARADQVPPFEFYAELLGRHRGRERLLARLGREAGDPIDEFLALALAYEREHVGSLEGFLHWLEAGQQDVKRDLEQGASAVRVMTVHGAKGLQAPVVILPDTRQLPQSADRLLWLGEEDILLWPPRRKLDDAVSTAAKRRQREAQLREYRRLLYVAMTRAEDRLYVCGWDGRHAMPEGCWYDLIQKGLAGRAEDAAFDFRTQLEDGWAGAGLRLTTDQSAEPEGRPAPERLAVAPAPLPDWVAEPVAPSPLPQRPLAPSRLAEPEPAPRLPLGAEAGEALRRGRLVHRLLELLPEVEPAARRQAAERLARRPAWGLDAAASRAAVDGTLDLIANADLAPLFGPNSRAEVPLAGMLPGQDGPRLLSGQVDRLVVTDAAVMVVDYKTNRQPPATEFDVPVAYLRQMAAYRALLQEIYPDRKIACYLLWTEALRLVELSPEALCDHAP